MRYKAVCSRMGTELCRNNNPLKGLGVHLEKSFLISSLVGSRTKWVGGFGAPPVVWSGLGSERIGRIL